MSEIKKYIKKPVVIEALEFTGWNWKECKQFMSDERLIFDASMSKKEYLIIPTLEGDMIALMGDFIIKGLRGEFYPCKPDVFHKKYKEFSERKE